MDLISTDWRDDAEHILPDLIELRRDIHREPELGLQNPKTLAKSKGRACWPPAGAAGRAINHWAHCDPERPCKWPHGVAARRYGCTAAA